MWADFWFFTKLDRSTWLPEISCCMLHATHAWVNFVDINVGIRRLPKSTKCSDAFLVLRPRQASAKNSWLVTGEGIPVAGHAPSGRRSATSLDGAAETTWKRVQ